jgi:hypothetical protein
MRVTMLLKSRIGASDSRLPPHTSTARLSD